MVSRTRTPLAALALCLGLIGAASPARAAPATETAEPSQTVLQMADWAVRSGDNQGLPFAIVDKGAARVFVFDANGAMLGADAALLGLTPGDESTPGIGDRELSDIPPEDRTTPAGRFLGGYGPAAGKQEDVLWIDFATAISLHAVVTTNPDENRVERLRSETIDDNRITFGCINVSKGFYTDVVQPTFSETQGVFYILPDSRALSEVFPSFDMETAFAGRGANSTRQGPHRPSEWW